MLRRVAMSSKSNPALALLACLLAACGQTSGHQLGGTSADGPVNLLSLGLCSENADLELIENMEDGNQAILQVGMRSGSWFSFNDGTGTQSPAMGTQLFRMATLEEPRGSSQKAMHTFG